MLLNTEVGCEFFSAKIESLSNIKDLLQRSKALEIILNHGFLVDSKKEACNWQPLSSIPEIPFEILSLEEQLIGFLFLFLFIYLLFIF